MKNVSHDIQDILKNKLIHYAMAGFIVAFGVSLLKISGTVTGGIVGVALIVDYIFNDVLSYGTWLLLLNVPFLVFGYGVYGLFYVVRVVLCMVCLSISADLILWKIAPYIPIYDSVLYSVILHMVAGVICAYGCVKFLNNQGSSGGTMVLFYWMYRKTGISMGILVGLFDVCVLLSAWVLLIDFQKFMYSLMTVIVMSIVMKLSKDRSGGI